MNSRIFPVSVRLIHLGIGQKGSKIGSQAKVMIKFLNGSSKK